MTIPECGIESYSSGAPEERSRSAAPKAVAPHFGHASSPSALARVPSQSWRTGRDASLRQAAEDASAVSRLADQLERSDIRDRVELGIVLQERSGLFDGTGGNEAIGRTTDRLASLPQYAVDLRRPDEERLPHFQIREVTQQELANAAELRVVLQTPQDLLQDDPRKGSGPSITARARSAFEYRLRSGAGSRRSCR